MQEIQTERNLPGARRLQDLFDFLHRLLQHIFGAHVDLRDNDEHGNAKCESNSEVLLPRNQKGLCNEKQ